MNDFKVLLQAAIDLQKSQNKLNEDIKELQKNAKIEIDLSTANAKKALNQFSKEYQESLKIKKSNLDQNISTYLSKNTKMTKDLRAEFLRLQTAINGVDDTKSLSNISKEVSTLKLRVKELGQEGRSVGDEIVNNVGKLFTWLSASTVIFSAIRAFKDVTNNVIELDKSLVDLQQATGYSQKQAQELLNTYIDLGQELGATGVEVANSASTWLRQGKSIAETNELIRASMILSKIGQIDSAQSTAFLTSAMKGYKLEASDVLGIVDKLSAIDLSSAVDSGGLAEAMSRVANMANLAGVSMDKLLSYLAIVGEVTQKDMASIGNSFQTMFARMGNIKIGKFVDDETGEQLNDVEKILDKLDIKLRDSKDSFRNFGDVLDEVGGRWSTFTETEQNAIGVAIAGTRNRENFLVLMENYSKSLEYAGISAESSGTAMDKFSAYEESAEAKTKKLQASLEELALKTINSDTVKAFLDLANVIVNATTSIGGLTPVITTLGGAFLVFKTGLLSGITKEILSVASGLAGMEVVSLGAMKAQIGLSGSIIATTTALKTFMLTNPLGWILAIGTAIGGVAWVYDKLTVSLEEQQEITQKLQSEYGEIQTQLQSVNSELQTTKTRIDELNAKDSLTIIEQQELDTLIQTNDELERQQRLLQEQEKTKQREVADSVVEEFNKDLNKSNEYQSLTKKQDVSLNGVDSYRVAAEITELDYLGEILNKYKELSQIDKKLITDEDKKKLEEYRNTLVDAGVKFEDYIDKYKIDDEVSQTWKAFAKEIDKTLNPAEYQSSAFDKVFNSDDFSKAKSELEELAKVRKLSEDDITSNEVYKKLIDETGMSAKQVVEQVKAITLESNKINSDGVNDLGNEILSLSKAMELMMTSGKAIEDAKSEIKDLGYISSDTLNKLISKYPELESVVAEYNSGLASTEDVLNELSKVYETDYKNYRNSVIAKIGESDSFYNSFVEKLPQWVKDLAKSYNLDFNNYKSLNESKLALDKEYASKRALLNKANNWQSKMQKSDKDIYNPFSFDGMIYEANEKLRKQFQKDADEINKIINGVNTSLDTTLNLKGYTSSSKNKKKKEKTPFSDSIDWAKSSIDELNRAVSNAKDVMDKNDPYSKQISNITTLISLQNELINGYKKQSKTYETAYAKSLKGIEQYRSKIESGKVFTIEDFKGDNREKTFKQVKQAQDYYKQFQDALDNEIKTRQSRDENRQERISIKIKADFEDFDKKLSSVNKVLSEIDFSIDFVDDGSIEQITLLQSGYEQASKSAEMLRSEIARLSKQYSDGKIDLKTYNERLEDLNNQQSNAVKSMKKYQDDIISAMKKRYDKELDLSKKALDQKLRDIEKERKAKIDALEEELKKYKEIIDAQKKAIQDQQETDNYNEQVDKYNEEISKMQSRVDLLKKAELTGDREAGKERRQLEEDLAKKKDELAKLQKERGVDLAIDALDEEYDTYEKMKNQQIKDTETLYDSEKLKAQETYDFKESNLNNLYENEKQLIIEAADLTKEKFTEAFEAINTALSQYGMSASPELSDVFGSTQKSASKNSSLGSLLSSGTGNSGQSELNQYVKSKYGTYLSYSEMVELARLLGVSGINSVKDVMGTTDNRTKILKALRAAGFSSGGYVDASMIRKTGEDGLALVKHGEPILTVEQGKQFKELISAMPKFNDLIKFNAPNISNITNNNSNAPNISITIPITGNADANTVVQLRKFETDIVNKVAKEILGVKRKS